MKLGRYLIERDETAAAFAKRVGVSASTITRLVRGERSPSLGLAASIQAATDNLVNPDDFTPGDKRNKGK